MTCTHGMPASECWTCQPTPATVQQVGLDWIGQNMRDADGVLGKVVGDTGPGNPRYLDIKFNNGVNQTVKMVDGHARNSDGVEWEYNPGKWAKL